MLLRRSVDRRELKFPISGSVSLGSGTAGFGVSDSVGFPQQFIDKAEAHACLRLVCLGAEAAASLQFMTRIHPVSLFLSG